MNVKYRRAGCRKWEDAIALEFYSELWGMTPAYFILRWDEDLQDFTRVVVPGSRIREIA